MSHDIETEGTFLLIHYHQIKCLALNESRIVSDFKLHKDLVFSRNNLEERVLAPFIQLYNLLQSRIQSPCKTVFLDVPSEVLIARIKARDREEEHGITKFYLESIKGWYLKHFEVSTDDWLILKLTGAETPEEVANLIVAQLPC